MAAMSGLKRNPGSELLDVIVTKKSPDISPESQACWQIGPTGDRIIILWGRKGRSEYPVTSFRALGP